MRPRYLDFLIFLFMNNGVLTTEKNSGRSKDLEKHSAEPEV